MCVCVFVCVCVCACVHVLCVCVCVFSFHQKTMTVTYNGDVTIRRKFVAPTITFSTIHKPKKGVSHTFHMVDSIYTYSDYSVY